MKRTAIGDQSVDEVNFGTEGAAFENNRRRRVTRHRNHTSHASVRAYAAAAPPAFPAVGSAIVSMPSAFAMLTACGQPARLE
jgi:hypothetical protein